MNNELLNQKKTEFGIFEAALATLLFVLLNVFFMESFVSIVKTGVVTDLGVLLAQFLVELLFGGAAYLVAIFCKTNIIKAAGLNKKVSVYMIVYGVLIAMCCIFFFASLTSSFLEFLALIGYSSSGGSMAVYDFWSYLGYVVAACVTPAVCEETLFRGTIQNGVKKFGKWASIIFASLIFMLMHGGPEQTIHQFIVGIIVGLIFYETGNLWITIIIHFFNNFISITQLFAFNMIYGSVNNPETETEIVEISMSEAWSNFATNLVVALILAAIGFVCVKWLIKKLKEENIRVNGQSIQNVEYQASQVVLVDGKEVETDISISENDNANSETETNKKKDRFKLNLKTMICFLVPIAWLVYVWVYELIIGFGG